MGELRLRSFEEAEQHLASLEARVTQLEDIVFTVTRKFDTLETPLWKRVLFRLDGFPGQADLDRDQPQWRPWRHPIRVRGRTLWRGYKS